VKNDHFLESLFEIRSEATPASDGCFGISHTREYIQNRVTFHVALTV